MNVQIKEALVNILALARSGNEYLSSQEPWNRIKKDRESAGTTLNVSIQVVNALVILLQPFLPNTTLKIRKILNLPENIQAGTLKRLQNSFIPTEHSILEPQALFTKLNIEKIKEKYHKLKTNGKRK